MKQYRITVDEETGEVIEEEREREEDNKDDVRYAKTVHTGQYL